MVAGSVDVGRHDGVWLLSLRGEHDLTTCETVRAQMRNLLGTGRGVVVDLSEAQFIDSSVIAALVAGHDESGTPAGDRVAIVVSGDGATPDRVVSLLGIDQMIPTFTSREAAARSIAHNGSRADGK